MGCTDFIEVLNLDGAFIDKTEFIKEFWTSNFQVNAILRPRRFGKTTNLRMLETFFSLKTAANYKQFFDEALLGFKNPQFVLDNFRAHPVLTLDLKDCTGRTWIEMRRWIWSVIRVMVFPYAHDLAEIAKNSSFLTTIFSFDSIDPPANEPDMEQILGWIMRCLYKVYGKRIVVLVDEYDSPLNHAFRHGYYESASKFFGTFYSFALKSNDALKKACLVGIVEPFGSGILSNLNNIGVFSVADERFSRHFGFTHDEISTYLNNNSDLVQEVLAWYDGYHIGSHRVVNPWSFMNFVSCWKFKSYWIQTSYFESVATVLEPHLQTVLLQTFRLLYNGTKGRVTVPELVSRVNYADATLSNSNDILHFLVLTGYLTYRPIENINMGVVSIPNKEIRMHWESKVVNVTRSFLSRRYPGFYAHLADSFQASPFSLKPLHDVMRRAILELCSFWDTKEENSYHCFFLGIFGMAIHDGLHTVVTSNLEAGVGRFDICIEFRDLKRVFLFEFKKSHCRETLFDDAKAGLKQILTNEYSLRFEEHYECILIGVSFCGKEISPLICTRTKQMTWDEVCRHKDLKLLEAEIYPAQGIAAESAQIVDGAGGSGDRKLISGPGRGKWRSRGRRRGRGGTGGVQKRKSH